MPGEDMFRATQASQLSSRAHWIVRNGVLSRSLTELHPKKILFPNKVTFTCLGG